MSDLRVENIKITDIKAIANLEFKAGTVTVISGPNGVGKSSVLHSLATLFDGGHDPDLIRRGAKKGEVVIGLSDGVTIKKSITLKGSIVKVTTENGGLVKSPQTYVKSLTHGMAFDPVAFVDATPKQRLGFLLDAMPITFTAEQLQETLGGMPMRAFDLDEFNALLEALAEPYRSLVLLSGLTGLRVELDEKPWHG